MAKLIYVINMSLDGYIEDATGAFNLYPHDDEVFATYTELTNPVGTFLYGRRLYETMAPWETEPALAAQSDLTAAFATVWQAADKVVYSTTLTASSTTRTRIEPRLDPASVREMKRTATADLTIGGEPTNPKITALVCTTDVLALGALDWARWQGIDVPGQLSITGFDGVDEALRESLTTVRQPQEEKGRRAGALLMSPSGSGVPIVEMLDTELLAGRTSGRIKG